MVTTYDLLLVRVPACYAVVEKRFHAMVAYPVTLQIGEREVIYLIWLAELDE